MCVYLLHKRRKQKSNAGRIKQTAFVWWSRAGELFLKKKKKFFFNQKRCPGILLYLQLLN